MEILFLLIIGFLGYKWYSEKKENSKYSGRNNKQNYSNTAMINQQIDIKPIISQADDSNEYIDTDKSPFLIANSLLTNTELNFYKVLKSIVPESQIICPKVRMQDVLWTKTYKVKDKQVFINKVNRKHFDFVICDRETLKPMMAIELDDKSHEEADRKERDEFVDALFSTSLKFKVIHITAKYTYDVNEIKEKLNQPVDNTSSTIVGRGGIGEPKTFID